MFSLRFPLFQKYSPSRSMPSVQLTCPYRSKPPRWSSLHTSTSTKRRKRYLIDCIHWFSKCICKRRMQGCTLGYKIKLDCHLSINISNFLLHLILSYYSILLFGTQTEAFLESDILGVILQETLHLSHFLLPYTILPHCLPLKGKVLNYVYSDHKFLEILFSMAAKSTISGSRLSAFKFCSSIYQF